MDKPAWSQLTEVNPGAPGLATFETWGVSLISIGLVDG